MKKKSGTHIWLVIRGNQIITHNSLSRNNNNKSKMSLLNQFCFWWKKKKKKKCSPQIICSGKRKHGCRSAGMLTKQRPTPPPHLPTSQLTIRIWLFILGLWSGEIGSGGRGGPCSLPCNCYWLGSWSQADVCILFFVIIIIIIGALMPGIG